ncbi:hypothetical protein N8I84_17920 [Streptomyces cynarae]|uniref:SAM-dependent methyltransferase n=1 Tax=Streptomyces cynarae TaxID=2981134 RepID=A0ABY6EE32_9ACTN|nr:hypothetical protein [Streptomyces cynarae]UXY24839.1 hypothetical protein N8I84_17920 [Streptomyces cynarae]
MHDAAKEYVMSGRSPTRAEPVLEPAAHAFAEATAEPPYLMDLGSTEGANA